MRSLTPPAAKWSPTSPPLRPLGGDDLLEGRGHAVDDGVGQRTGHDEDAGSVGEDVRELGLDCGTTLLGGDGRPQGGRVVDRHLLLDAIGEGQLRVGLGLEELAQVLDPAVGLPQPSGEGGGRRCHALQPSLSGRAASRSKDLKNPSEGPG